MTRWWDGGMTRWWDDEMVGWWDDEMVGWWDDEMVGWRDDSIREMVLQSREPWFKSCCGYEYWIKTQTSLTVR